MLAFALPSLEISTVPLNDLLVSAPPFPLCKIRAIGLDGIGQHDFTLELLGYMVGGDSLHSSQHYYVDEFYSIYWVAS